MIGTIKIAELLPNQLLGPIWAKVWIGFWLCMALYCGVLACQQWRVKRKEKSQQSRHLGFSRLAEGKNVDPQSKLAVDSDLNGPKADKFWEL
jgi:hypothetical protein